MTDTTTISPNPVAPVAAPADTNQSAVPSLDSIAAKMTAMKQETMRNQLRATEPTATGNSEAAATQSPVTPDGVEVADTNDDDVDSDNQENEAQDEPVSDTSNDSNGDDLIDFLEFANTNPNAKFKFLKNGKEVIIDAKKAAAILGQGSAIHEEARQLKIEKADFEEYREGARRRQDDLLLAMEFTTTPRLKKAYNEIRKTQEYQVTFQQQLSRLTDQGQIARVQASMAQNEQYIRQQQKQIQMVAPKIAEYREARGREVLTAVNTARQNFKDTELKNDYVFNEIREKIAKTWPGARNEIVPGIPNLDIVSADESLLSLIRDGLRYRDKPASKTAGASMAALTGRKGTSSQRAQDDGISKLREQANAGDKKAGDNLLMAQLQRMRQGRGR